MQASDAGKQREKVLFFPGRQVPISMALLKQSNDLAPERYFIAGFRNQAAALGATTFWAALAATLRHLEGAGIDAIVDLGRFNPDDLRTPLLQASDSVLVVAEPVLPDIAALGLRLPQLRSVLSLVGGDAFIDLVLSDAVVDPYSAREISKAVGTPVLGTIAHDVAGASVYSLGAQAPRKFEQGPYQRTLRSTVATLDQKLRERRERLGYRPEPSQEEVTA